MDNKREELLKLLEERERLLKYNKIMTMFPDTGKFRRELYPKHLDFFHAGKYYRQRMFIAANRVGKTTTMNVEISYHTTGKYPDWWEGKRYSRPVEVVVASISADVTRDTFQKELLGDYSDPGTGYIPKEDIKEIVKKHGSPRAIKELHIKHVSGGTSIILFKSYEQGRDTFQGTHPDIIALDEEPKDPDVYTECLTRLMGTGGIEDQGSMMVGFTPLLGMSELVEAFLPEGKIEAHVPIVEPFEKKGTRYLVNVSWDDVPHLSKEDKEELLEGYKEKERDARSKGIPALGIYSIYPVIEEDIKVEAFKIPQDWNRFAGMYIGSENIAMIWAVQDPQTDIIYIVHEKIVKRETVSTIIEEYSKKGDEIPVSLGAYKEPEYFAHLLKGLNIYTALNNVEPQIAEIYDLFENNKVYIFEHLEKTLSQLRLYRREQNGKILNRNHELMEAMRFAITTGKYYGINYTEEEHGRLYKRGQNPITGY